ncbi:hypothetical protein Ancab_035598 [Ancistrocladus abbreviatus]
MKDSVGNEVDEGPRVSRGKHDHCPGERSREYIVGREYNAARACPSASKEEAGVIGRAFHRGKEQRGWWVGEVFTMNEGKEDNRGREGHLRGKKGLMSVGEVGQLLTRDWGRQTDRLRQEEPASSK